MFAARLRHVTLWVQGVYTFITALWPIVHIDSFMLVSGYKLDIWLVKIVSILLLSISLCLLVSIYAKEQSFAVGVLALTTSTGLAYADFFYAGSGVISKVYLADGLAEIVFAISWIYILVKESKPARLVD